MPKGPEGRRRPTDVIGSAVLVAKIATREAVEDAGPGDDGKDPAAQALGKKGGAARAKALSAEQRSEIARKGAVKRWAAHRGATRLL